MAGLGVDVRPLIPAAVAAGGHVRVGLEDAPLGTGIANLDWVRAARGPHRRVGRPARHPGRVARRDEGIGMSEVTWTIRQVTARPSSRR